MPCIFNVQADWWTHFKLVFDQIFQCEGNRAIVFQLNQRIPTYELKECIRATLLYHKVKQLKTLGILN